MTDTPSVAGKTWRALKRTASGLGGSKPRRGGSGLLKSTSLEGTKERPSTDSVKVETGIAQNGQVDANEETSLEPAANGIHPSTSSSREQFLNAYDAATLELANRTSSTQASCLGDVPLQEVAPWNRSSGFLGHLNSGQEAALQQMKDWFPESRGWHTDHDLLRFLRAREFDVLKTRDMYSKYIREYRGRHMTSPNPPVRPTAGAFASELAGLYPERERALTDRMHKLMQWFLHTVAMGPDKDGRPVVYFRPADILRQNMIKFVPIEDRLAFQSAANEAISVLLKLASQRAGFHIESITQVLDLSGMSAMQMVSHMRSPGAQQEWQHNLDFVPELLYRVYIVNAPTGMSMVWKVASLFVPAQTKRKVSVLGSSYKAELQAAIGRENMPSCYGGSIEFEWPRHKPVKELQY